MSNAIKINIQNDDVERLVYNIAFSQQGGKFRKDSILQELEKRMVEVDNASLENIFNGWVRKGRVFKSANNYIVSNVY